MSVNQQEFNMFTVYTKLHHPASRINFIRNFADLLIPRPYHSYLITHQFIMSIINAFTVITSSLFLLLKTNFSNFPIFPCCSSLLSPTGLTPCTPAVYQFSPRTPAYLLIDTVC